MTSLSDLLGQAAAQPIQDGFFASYGLLRNPFPPARTIYPEVIYNQEAALRRFAQNMQPVLQGDLARRAMAIIGGTGAGKSHFLRHCQYHVSHMNLPLVSVEFLAGISSSAGLVREIIRSADGYAKDRGEQDFLSAIVNRVRDDGDLGPVRQSDLRTCLKTLISASQENYVPKDMYQRYNAEVLNELGRRWLAGGTLTQTERRYLGVSSRLATGSLMIRVASELFALARAKGFVLGVLLCLDEVEALFTSGVSTAKIQAFLQDFRYFFDEAVGKDSGYSLVIVSASTLTGSGNLRDFNYPLFQRLGFETESREQLHQVTDMPEARAFAKVYLEYEKSRFDAVPGAKKISLERTLSLIGDEDLSAALFGNETRQSTPTSQARFLEELHRAVEQKRAP